MSRPEIDRLDVLQRVRAGHMSLIAAALAIGRSERQVRRLLRRYEGEGPAGLISRRRGRPSNNRLPRDLIAQAIALVRERYGDFGPTYANEKLREVHQLRISTETLRQAMIAANLWTLSRKRRRRPHPARERRPSRGELVQIDGSLHPWFEDRGPRCSLLVFIDDATSELMELRFAASETTLDYLAAFRRYVERYGRPLAAYSDRHAIFRSTKGTDAPTQVGRALAELGVELICAGSPQAKGRVERANQTLQRRLVRELRLRNISSMHEANAYLDEFRVAYNARFAQPPASEHDAHRPSDGFDLDAILAARFTRRLSKDGTVRLNNDIVLAQRDDVHGGELVEVLQTIENHFQLRCKGAPLAFRRLRDAQSHAQLLTSKELNERLDRRKQQPLNPRKGHTRRPTTRGGGMPFNDSPRAADRTRVLGANRTLRAGATRARPRARHSKIASPRM